MVRCALPLLACVLAGSASASVVQYINTNPALDDLPSLLVTKDFVRESQAIDIRQDAFHQPAPGGFFAPPPGTFHFVRQDGSTSSAGAVVSIQAGADVRIASYIVEDFKKDFIYGFPQPGEYGPVESPQHFAVGDAVDGSWNWTEDSPVWGVGSLPGGGGSTTIRLLDEHAIIGIELTLDTGVHYGFVELLQVGTEPGLFGAAPLYTAVRWGWETDAGVALVIPPIPAPGAGALLGLAGLAASRRRR